MTRVRVDADALAQWSRLLDSLSPLAPQLAAVSTLSVVDELSAAELDRANADGMRALTEVVASFDATMSDLRDTVRAVAYGYRAVDDRVASMPVFDDRD
jgi:hypothetical protein